MRGALKGDIIARISGGRGREGLWRVTPVKTLMESDGLQQSILRNGPHRSHKTFKRIFLVLGPSNSRRKIRSHVPRRSMPFSMMI